MREVLLYQEFDVLGFKEIKEFLFFVDVDLRGEIEPRYILSVDLIYTSRINAICCG